MAGKGLNPISSLFLRRSFGWPLQGRPSGDNRTDNSQAAANDWFFGSTGTATTYVLTLSATSTTTVLVGPKALSKTVTATCSTTATSAKRMFKQLLATCSTTATSAKRMFKQLLATCASTLTGTANKVTAGTAILLTLQTTCNTTASSVLRVGKRLTATASTTASMIKTVAKRLTATASSLLTGLANKGVVYPKILTTTCTTAGSVFTSFTAFVLTLASEALKLYRPKSYPTLNDDPSTYILAELRKISAFLEQHVQVTKDLEQRINDGGL